MGEKNHVLASPQRRNWKFDLSSPVGIIVGVSIVLAAILLGGGGIKDFKKFLDISS
ncbi:flagellar motor protein MotP, partial [Bacillus cereus]|nr:flagellar motor protein MotP [Bacillus cereus]